MQRGEIYKVELDAPGTVPGHEIIGYRPVLVISPQAYNNRSLFVLVVPFTLTQETERLPFTIPVEVTTQNGLDSRSILLVLQLRSLDNRRFRGRARIGIIESNILVRTMGMINEMI